MNNNTKGYSSLRFKCFLRHCVLVFEFFFFTLFNFGRFEFNEPQRNVFFRIYIQSPKLTKKKFVFLTLWSDAFWTHFKFKSITEIFLIFQLLTFYSVAMNPSQCRCFTSFATRLMEYYLFWGNYHKSPDNFKVLLA